MNIFEILGLKFKCIQAFDNFKLNSFYRVTGGNNFNVQISDHLHFLNDPNWVKNGNFKGKDYIITHDQFDKHFEI